MFYKRASSGTLRFNAVFIGEQLCIFLSAELLRAVHSNDLKWTGVCTHQRAIATNYQKPQLSN